MQREDRDPLRRSLSAAQRAYADHNVEASKLAHEGAQETHDGAGEYIKAAVFGGLDGILTSFAVVAGAAGGQLVANVVLIVGFSNLVAGALGMGVGEFLSDKAEKEYAVVERQRESWELQYNPAGEIAEMVQLYVGRGMSLEDATNVISTLAKYEKLFVDIMMSEELGIQAPKSGRRSLVSSLVMFLSFILFGSVPLLSFAVLPSELAAWKLESAIGVTLLALGGLGAVKSRFSTRSWCVCALETCILGACCASVAYLMGKLVESLQKAP